MTAPEYEQRLQQLAPTATNDDLIYFIVSQYPKGLNQVKYFAEQFRKPTIEETAKNVWQYCRNEFKYQRDHPDYQTLKLPSAALHIKKFDCKSFSIFIASVIGALKIKNGFKFTSYRSNLIPSHVYNYCFDENGKKIFIDGCTNVFNREKKYTLAKIYTNKI